MRRDATIATRQVILQETAPSPIRETTEEGRGQEVAQAGIEEGAERIGERGVQARGQGQGPGARVVTLEEAAKEVRIEGIRVPAAQEVATPREEEARARLIAPDRGPGEEVAKAKAVPVGVRLGLLVRIPREMMLSLCNRNEYELY